MPELLAALQKLISNNPGQTQRLVQLRPSVEARLPLPILASAFQWALFGDGLKRVSYSRLRDDKETQECKDCLFQ